MRLRLAAALTSLSCLRVAAQIQQPPPECGIREWRVCAKHVLSDERGIVASPIHTRPKDLLWIAPLAAAVGFSVSRESQVGNDLAGHPNRQQDFQRFSNYAGFYAPVAAAAGGYLIGNATHDDHLRRTATLAAESMADGALLNLGLKYAIDRQKPQQGDGTGRFWPHGPSTWPDGQSMPSGHSENAWNFAHVVGDQYNGWLTRLTVYSLAASVSASRVMAREHFPSDVIVGGAIGYLVGGFVIHRRGDGSGFALSTVQTENGKGFQLSYNFRH